MLHRIRETEFLDVYNSKNGKEGRITDYYNAGQLAGIRKERKKNREKLERRQQNRPEILELLEAVPEIPKERMQDLTRWAIQYKETA